MRLFLLDGVCIFQLNTDFNIPGHGHDLDTWRLLYVVIMLALLHFCISYEQRTVPTSHSKQGKYTDLESYILLKNPLRKGRISFCN